MTRVFVRNLARRSAPRLPLAACAKRILPACTISLAFISARAARTLNRRLRGKAYVPDVLAYALGEHDAEVLICLERAAEEASAYRRSAPVHCLALFIHALLHLKGMRHGSTMERREQALLREFGALARL